MIRQAFRESSNADYWAVCLIAYVMGFTVPVAGCLLFVTWAFALIIENVQAKGKR